MSTILSVSDRGQLTLPKQDRKKFSKHFLYHVEDGKIILEPLQTRDEFLNELDESFEDYKKNGGKSLDALMEEYES